MRNKEFVVGPAGRLEIKINYPQENQKSCVGIICHPHPLHGGTMENKVVTTIAKAFESLGVLTVCFNFRGVGLSEGSYAQTVGETEDLLAIIRWVKKKFSDYALWLAGFSFGAYIAANAANQVSASQLVSIAPPVNHFNFNHFPQINCPWLVIQGDEDEVVPLESVEAWARNQLAPIQFIVMSKTSHFFHGKLMDLREILIKELSNNL